MDIGAGNTLPNPYSDHAGEAGQPVFPWRGRITCSPAAGFAGSPDKTAGAAAQVAAFFGDAAPSDFDVSGETVSWTGPSGDWGLRRMILHYAHLCAAAGGVDAFLIGSEMRGLTQVRSGAGSLSGGAAAARSRRRLPEHPRGRHEDQLRRRLVGIFRAPPGRRLRRRLLPPRSALGRRGDRFHRHRQLHAALGLARRRRSCSTRSPAGRRSTTSTICDRTSRAAKASTGSMPARPTARRRTARRSATGSASLGSSASRICGRGGRTRISTGRAGSRAARRRPGCPRASRSASPRPAARRSTRAPTSRTCSSTRNPRNPSRRISRAPSPTI